MAGSSKFWPKAPSQEPPSFLTKETLLSDIQDPPILPLISTVLLVASLCTFTLVYDHITEVSQKEVAWMLHGTPQRGSAWPGVQALSILSFKVQEHKHSMLQNIRCLRNSHKLKRLAREYETRPFYHIDLGVGGNVDCTPDRTIPANIDKKWLTLMLADRSHSFPDNAHPHFNSRCLMNWEFNLSCNSAVQSMRFYVLVFSSLSSAATGDMGLFQGRFVNFHIIYAALDLGLPISEPVLFFPWFDESY